jgi:glycerol-3-phosphate dehydrogenase
MNFSQKLLTELKATCGLPSDGRAAALLDITRQSVSHVVTGRRQFCDDTLVKIAHLLNKNPIEVLATKHIETNESVIMTQVWKDILEKDKIAASLTLLGLQPDKVA